MSTVLNLKRVSNIDLSPAIVFVTNRFKQSLLPQHWTSEAFEIQYIPSERHLERNRCGIRLFTQDGSGVQITGRDGKLLVPADAAGEVWCADFGIELSGTWF